MQFLLAVVSCRGETQCGGNVHNVSSTRVAEFDFLTENLDSGCLICAYSHIYLFIYSHIYLFNMCLDQCTKFHLQSMLGSFTRESP